jgi:BMFP domain-containing protein YqiC
MEIREELDKIRESLIRQRDELRLKTGLAKLEVREEWVKIEAKVDQFLVKLEVIGEEAKDASEEVLKSAKALGEEIEIAYGRIKTQL